MVIEAFLEAAKRYVRGGYDVMVDGIIGPWFLDPWVKTAQDNYELNVIDTTDLSIEETVLIIKEKIE